ncbi:MAG: nicotinate (nicotinamide) nucleotide adenylyltransferase [Planctomycetes bacterium]|nr:nicotinate (nicotinamide) nucleotide adenylyltransferase [Planctomycetota bacterium]
MAGVLLFGGSFDPIHYGHLIVSRCAAEQLAVERIILTPGAHPPHKRGQQLTAAQDRLEMCRRAVADDPLFEVSDWESRQAGPNYTLRTVQHFRAVLPARTRLHWLLGMDSLVELGTWYKVGELAAACSLVSAGRPGYDRPGLSELAGVLTAEQIEALRENILETPLIEISATDIRARVRAGLSIRHLVPDAVREYIAARGLYAAC